MGSHGREKYPMIVRGKIIRATFFKTRQFRKKFDQNP